MRFTDALASLAGTEVMITAGSGSGLMIQPRDGSHRSLHYFKILRVHDDCFEAAMFNPSGKQLPVLHTYPVSHITLIVTASK